MAETGSPQRWLVLRLEAPLLAFGGVRIDQIGPTRDFPALSMLTGLLANALGLRRTDFAAHQALQDRLVFAAGLPVDDGNRILLDVQNARLDGSGKNWTTRGAPEGRGGGSYGAPHRRYRSYLMDACALVVLRLADPADQPDQPDPDRLAAALQRPARPLFIGRKPCLPATPLFQGFVQADGAHAALHEAAPTPLRAIWPAGEGPMDGPLVDRIIDLADLRDWTSGLHSGSRRIVEGRVLAGKDRP